MKTKDLFFGGYANMITSRLTKNNYGQPAVIFTFTDHSGQRYHRKHGLTNVRAMFEKAQRLANTPQDRRHQAALASQPELAKALKILTY